MISRGAWVFPAGGALDIALVVPFLVLDRTALAVRVSNLVGLAVLFIAGWVLAKYAGAKPWQGAITLAVTGAVLITAIIALGG